MDTSKEYKKMCLKAFEIQRDKKILFLGDFYVDLNDPEEESIILDISALTTTPDIVWLPRQDQLQEMAQETAEDNVNGVYHLLFHFAGLFIDNLVMLSPFHLTYKYNFETMEQLWLAYIMKEKFNKIWNGEDWIKIK